MGKGGSIVTGYWYRVGYHHGISSTPIDAFLEFRGGDKTAWAGELTSTGMININAPYLWGGEKDQGGIVGLFEVMFGDDDQQPNSYLTAAFGPQVPGWRGVTTGVFRGGRFGALNPYPQKPAYKIRAIKKGWDNDTCWYPETAEIAVVSAATLPSNATGWEYQLSEQEDNPGYDNLGIPTADWIPGAQGPFAGGTLVGTGETDWPIGNTLWVRRTVTIRGINQKLTVRAENGCVIFINGAIAGAVNRSNQSIDGNQSNTFEFPLQAGQTYELAIKAFDEADYPGGGTQLWVQIAAAGLIAMNPAHVLYEARTAIDRGAEPIDAMADANWRAAADWFYAQGFGICTEFDPDAESVDSFIARIEKVCACSVNRSPVDGLWYLDIANGVYDLESLPILTDDDILDWEHTPSIPDDAVNSLSVEYEDIQQKVTVTTPPVRALALISANGLNHDVRQFHELPTGDLGARVAQRELAAIVTPTRAFTLTTTRKPYNWRRYTYFRLQAAKLGITDMVCLLAEKSSGTLKSGAMKISAVQDIYNLTSASYAQVEDGVDTRPPQIPLGIVDQLVFEAPYTELVRRLTRADLAALPTDVGYLMTVAKDPSASRDYTITVSTDDGTTYTGTAQGPWCPTALVVEGDTLTDAEPQTSFTLSGGVLLGNVAVGQAAVWGGEQCRVDAIDTTDNTIELGRGCIDTPPIAHAPGERIWFYDGYAGADRVEYTDGEAIDVALLTNTGTQQLDPDLATPLALTFDQRQYRPYAPGNFKLNGEAYPSTLSGEITATWAHRDRLLQADQLVDTTEADVGPEAGTTYHLSYYLDGTLVNEEASIAGTAGTPYTYASGGLARIELQAERDSLASWRSHVVEFTYEGEVVPNFIAFPLTYDEADYAGTMTWVRQGNGPHVTPQGFEGDGYEARLTSTTIPTWMQPASAPLTLHASMSFYPQQLKGTSEYGLMAGTVDGYAKLILAVRSDVTNSKISQLCLRGGTTGTSFVELVLGRTSWKYQGRNPDLNYGAYSALPQAIGFIDADTMLLTCHFEDTRSRIYKIRISDFAVLGYFDSTTYPHVANMAQRSNGDWWFGLNSGRIGLVDLDTSFSSGVLALSAYSELPDSGAGAIEFVTVSGTEYFLVGQYVTSGAGYFYVYPTTVLGNATISATDRYKRFSGGPRVIQGQCMRSGQLIVSSKYAPGTAAVGGFISTFDIVSAITTTADGATITASTMVDAASASTEDIAVHPTTNDAWTPIEGVTGAGSDASGAGLTVWSSALDGALVENHYTCEYDGIGATTVRINNRTYDVMDGVLGNDVACVAIGGPPGTSGGMTNRFFTGFVRNVVLQDQPMTNDQYAAAVAGDYEPNTLTAYEFSLTNPGAEAGTSPTGWTNESGGLGVLTYPTDSATLPHSGSRFFSGGTSASTIARQRLDILAQTGLSGAEVDAGGSWAKLRWWQASLDGATDPAGMGLRTLNSSSVSQGEAYAGVATTPNSSGTYRPWYPRCFSASLPSGARSIDALQKMSRTSGTNNDGWIDDVRVTVYRP